VSIYGDQLVAASSSVANTVSLTLAGSTVPNSYLTVAGGGTTVFLSGTSLSSSYATSGALTGLEAAYQMAEGYLGQLDTLAYSLVQEVNMQHQEGANGQALVSNASTTFASGSFYLTVGSSSSVTISFSNTLGTNLGLLQSMAQAINNAGDGATATVVDNPQNGTAYLNVVSSTSTPVSISLSDVSGGSVIAYTGYTDAATGSGYYTSTYDYNGNPGGLFFAYLASTVGAATDISLSSNISPNANGANANLDALAAASSTTDQRDGNNALAICNLQNATWAALDSGTFDSYYQTITEKVGADVQNATDMQETAQTTNTQLVNMQQSVSGVSTDDEMTKLVQFQYAYQAAADFLSVQNNLLNTLVNNTLTTG